MTTTAELSRTELARWIDDPESGACPLTAAEVTRLRDEAGAAGDAATYDLCDRCLSPLGRLRGELGDLLLIAEMVDDAAAQRDA